MSDSTPPGARRRFGGGVGSLATALSFAIAGLVVVVSLVTKDRWTLLTAVCAGGLVYPMSWSFGPSGSTERQRLLVMGIVSIVLVAFTKRIVGAALWNLHHVPEWDFLSFWVHAQSAAKHLDFYDPRNASLWLRGSDVSADFRREILDVGFWYPPPSMFMFWALGGMSPMGALLFWYALQGAALLAAIVILTRFFAGRPRWMTVAPCAALVAVHPATLATVAFGQTNFLMFLSLLLFWPFRRGAAGGVALAVGIFIKPFLVVLLIVPVLERRWRVVVGFAVAVGALLASSAAAFGFGTFVHYLRPTAEKPSWIYSEPTNQSLLGVLHRLMGTACGGEGCLRYPPFILTAVVLLGATVWLARRFIRTLPNGDEWALALFLPCGLLIYPVAQFHYSIVLLVPLLLLLREHAGSPADMIPNAAALVAVFGLCSLKAGTWTAAGSGLTWAVVAARGWVRCRGPASSGIGQTES